MQSAALSQAACNIYIVASEAVLPETDIFWLKTQQANSNPLFRQVFTGG